VHKVISSILWGVSRSDHRTEDVPNKLRNVDRFSVETTIVYSKTNVVGKIIGAL